MSTIQLLFELVIVIGLVIIIIGGRAAAITVECGIVITDKLINITIAQLVCIIINGTTIIIAIGSIFIITNETTIIVALVALSFPDWREFWA